MKTLVKKILPQPALDLVRQSARRIGICMERCPQGTQIFSDPARQIFFGYYDVTPFNSDGSILLAVRAVGENASPHETHPELEIGYFDLAQKSPEFRQFGATETWNWQQGCRLQWFEEKAGSIIYNTKSGSIVQNIRAGQILQAYDRPVYVIDRHRHYGLSLDFARLHQFRRGYGYSNVSATDEGVTRIDLKTGQSQEILSLDAIRNFLPLPGMENRQHYINHLAFNPSGTRFMLFHVWTDGGAVRNLRLLTAATDGGALHSPCPDIRPSHYTWMDDKRLLITGTKGKKVVYAIVHDQTNETEILESPCLNEDGHPSLMEDGKVISDTYPDLFGQQKIFLYHPEKSKAETIAAFHSPGGFNGETRCDLHPRLSPAQDKVCADIVRKGRRAMCVIPLRRT
ncbi:MAG: hypothetical protein WBK55_06060 [Alphaproteobacteria bacterium]